MSVAFRQTAGRFQDSLFGQDKCVSQCNKPNLAAGSFSDFPAGPRAPCLIILLSGPAHSSPLSLSCPRHFGQSEWQPTLALITLNWPRRANISPKSHVLISLSLFYPACLLTDLTGSVGVKQIWHLVRKKFTVFCDFTVLKPQRTKTLLVIKNTKQPSLELNGKMIVELANFNHTYYER